MIPALAGLLSAAGSGGASAPGVSASPDNVAIGDTSISQNFTGVGAGNNDAIFRNNSPLDTNYNIYLLGGGLILLLFGVGYIAKNRK